MATMYWALSIHVGEDTLIGRDCSPLMGIAIGDRCVIEAGNTRTAHESITIGVRRVRS